MPPKTVKTILNELVKLQPKEVELSAQRIDSSSPGYKTLRECIASMMRFQSSKLEESEATEQVEKKETQNSITQTTDGSTESSNVVLSEEVRERLKLAQIFRQLRDKKTENEGIESLRSFMSDHPQVDLQPYLEKCSQEFQKHIHSLLNPTEVDVADTIETNDSENVAPNKSNETTASMQACSMGNFDAQSYISRLRELQKRTGLRSESDTTGLTHTQASNSLLYSTDTQPTPLSVLKERLSKFSVTSDSLNVGSTHLPANPLTTSGSLFSSVTASLPNNSVNSASVVNPQRTLDELRASLARLNNPA